MPRKLLGGIIYPFQSLNCEAVEVWEYDSNVIPHFQMDVITQPHWG